AGTVVGVTASSTDVAGGSAVYSLSDTAGGRFQIGASSGVVTVAPGAVIDYESNTSFTITVLVTVGSLTSTETFTINVLNADPTAPIDSNSGVNLVAEGAAAGALVGVTASAADPAGGAITYSLSNDAGGRFTINPTTGVVTVASGAVIDFESDGGSYTITVVASDGASSKSSDFNINISHPNATAFLAPDLTNPAGTSLYVYGTDGKDAIKVVLKNGVYVVTIGRTNLGSFNPTERIYVYGGDGNDTIDVGATTTLPTVIYGNGGNDTINGGLGADIIIGGAGNDTISGRGGRDLIIGGTGVDRITGHGSGSTAANEGNIMIGDSTDHDSNLAALSAISAAWVANNSSTEATVRSYFSSTTINADGAADAITQTKLGVDWAFAFELKTNGQKLDKLSLATNDLLN
ncbi:MAG TPA: cadherin domain-containing protein, partial [Pirellulales bacterium]